MNLNHMIQLVKNVTIFVLIVVGIIVKICAVIQLHAQPYAMELVIVVAWIVVTTHVKDKLKKTQEENACECKRRYYKCLNLRKRN